MGVLHLQEQLLLQSPGAAVADIDRTDDRGDHQQCERDVDQGRFVVVGREQRRVERHPVEFVRLLLLADDFALFEPQQRILHLHGTGIGHAGLGIAVQLAEHACPLLVAIREMHARHGVAFGGADQRIREGQRPGVLPVPDGIEVTFAVVAACGRSGAGRPGAYG